MEKGKTAGEREGGFGDEGMLKMQWQLIASSGGVHLNRSRISSKL